jgi:hypothetical protein
MLIVQSEFARERIKMYTVLCAKAEVLQQAKVTAKMIKHANLFIFISLIRVGRNF